MEEYPSFSIGGCTLVNADSFVYLDDVKDESVDALVTDPTFGIGFNYDGEIEETKDPESYWRWFSRIYTKMLAKVKQGGFVAVWQTQLYFKHFWSWFGDKIHVYAGCKNFVQIRKTPINYGYDPIIMFYKDGARPLVPKVQKRSIDYSVCTYNFDEKGIFVDDFFVADTAHFGNRDHPCPRPVGQVDQILRNYTIENAVVLDGFAGWATTAISCMKNKRKFIGIEIKEKYYRSSVERMKRAWKEISRNDDSLDKFVSRRVP